MKGTGIRELRWERGGYNQRKEETFLICSSMP
jgi:hypothetical protein